MLRERFCLTSPAVFDSSDPEDSDDPQEENDPNIDKPTSPPAEKGDKPLSKAESNRRAIKEPKQPKPGGCQFRQIKKF